MKGVLKIPNPAPASSFMPCQQPLLCGHVEYCRAEEERIAITRIVTLFQPGVLFQEQRELGTDRHIYSLFHYKQFLQASHYF